MVNFNKTFFFYNFTLKYVFFFFFECFFFYVFFFESTFSESNLFLWCWDCVKNSWTLFLFYKYWSHRKNVINKIIFFSDLQWYPEIWSDRLIGCGDTKYVGKISSISYNSCLFKNYCKYQKTFFSKIVFFLYFTSVYQILCNFIYWVKSYKCSIYPPPPSHLFFRALASVRIWISRGAIFFLHK